MTRLLPSFHVPMIRNLIPLFQKFSKFLASIKYRFIISYNGSNLPHLLISQTIMKMFITENIDQEYNNILLLTVYININSVIDLFFFIKTDIFNTLKFLSQILKTFSLYVYRYEDIIDQFNLVIKIL